jgi:ethanolamine ammonia-lyase small subunit
MSKSLVEPDPWRVLSRFTPARIGLGRVGPSLPTAAMLDFSMAHARARSVIHSPLDVNHLAQELESFGFATRRAWSQAEDRTQYLHRPDLGRRLAAECVDELRSGPNSDRRLSVVIGDGLSSLAPAQHAAPLLRILAPRLTGWEMDDITIATQARVALGDEIGSLRGAEAIVMLIGERPGLNAADSLGAYLTYKPYVGRSDAERNCVSNIRPTGLSYEHAAYKLLYLLHGARRLGGTGVQLKDDSEAMRSRTLDEPGRMAYQSGKVDTRPEDCR